MALEGEVVGEEEAMSHLVNLSSDKKRTWKENKLLKAARKKDRRHFDDREGRPLRPVNRRRLSIEEIKKVTHWATCGRKGHWKEDCREPPRDPGRTLDKTKTCRQNAFVFLGSSDATSSSRAEFFVTLLNYQLGAQENFLEIAPIVDPGASQELIGLPSFERLEKKLAEKGLRTIRLGEIPSPASGVGGSAHPLFSALTPRVLGGQPGVVKLTIVKENIPQLLSIGLLEMSKAVIDTGLNKILFREFDSQANMGRLPSGHSHGMAWPKKLGDDFGLSHDAFNLKPEAREAYMADPAAKRSTDRFPCFHASRFLDDIGIEQWILEETTGQELVCDGRSFFLDRVLGNFLGLREPKRESQRFRSSWFLLGSHVLELERDVCLAELSDVTSLHGVLELSDLPVDFSTEHWSKAKILQLFCDEPYFPHSFSAYRPTDASNQQPVSDQVESLRDLNREHHDVRLTHRESSEVVPDSFGTGSGRGPVVLAQLHPEVAGYLPAQHLNEAPGGLLSNEGRDSTSFPRASADGQGEVLSPEGVPGQGSQPAWDLDKVQSVQREAVLCEVDNPPPLARKGKSVVSETYVGRETAPLSLSSASSSAAHEDLQMAMQNQTQDLMQNQAQLMTHIMSPVIEGFHQALDSGGDSTARPGASRGSDTASSPDAAERDGHGSWISAAHSPGDGSVGGRSTFGLSHDVPGGDQAVGAGTSARGEADDSADGRLGGGVRLGCGRAGAGSPALREAAAQSFTLDHDLEGFKCTDSSSSCRLVARKATMRLLV